MQNQNPAVQNFIADLDNDAVWNTEVDRTLRFTAQHTAVNSFSDGHLDIDVETTLKSTHKLTLAYMAVNS